MIGGRDWRGLSGVTVSVGRISDKGYLTSGRQATTDAEGRFVGYIEPGKVVVSVVEAPEGYVVPRRQGQPAKMDAVKEIAWPPIKLQRAARLEGIVVDESGKPVPDAEVQSLSPRNEWRFDVGIERTDAGGKFAIGGLLGNETLALRARTETAVSGIAQLRPSDASGPIRIVVSPAKGFAIRGECRDAAGRAIAQAKVAASAAWMLGPRGIGFSAGACETDAAGRFELRPLWPGFDYQVSVIAENYDKFESERIKAEPGQTHNLGLLTLVSIGGFVEGVVTDSSGRPIPGVRVFNSGDAPKVLSANTEAAGRFRLAGFRAGPVYVFAEKEGCRFSGVRTETSTPTPLSRTGNGTPTPLSRVGERISSPLSRRGRGAGGEGVKIQLLRNDEPVAPWKPHRPPLPFAQQQKIVRQVLEELWATSPHGNEPWAIRLMARIDLEQARKWSAGVGGRYDHDLLWDVVQRTADADLDEALALLAPEGDVSRTLMGLAQRYIVSDPPKAMRCAEEAVVQARKLDQPQRALALAQAGALVVRLGNAAGGHKVIEEAADMAAKMATEGYQAYVRGHVAAALAPHDLRRAIGLVERVSERNEKDRVLARIATAIASRDLGKALEILARVDKRSTLPDMARMQIAYELAPTRRDDAVRVVAVLAAISRAAGRQRVARDRSA